MSTSIGSVPLNNTPWIGTLLVYTTRMPKKRSSAYICVSSCLNEIEGDLSDQYVALFKTIGLAPRDPVFKDTLSVQIPEFRESLLRRIRVIEGVSSTPTTKERALKLRFEVLRLASLLEDQLQKEFL